MYYLYELINSLGTIEYVGQTKNPDKRFRQHIFTKPVNSNKHSGNGKFYGRQDIFMNIVGTYNTENEVRNSEYSLQLEWGLPTDKFKNKSGGAGKKRNQGSTHSISKLTEPQVLEIKKLLIDKVPYSKISKQFNISPTVICRIN